jgi:KAP family P-loop domain
MSFLRRIAERIEGHDCEHIIKQIGSEFSLSIPGQDSGVVDIDVKRFSKELDELGRATDIAFSLDHMQYLLCKTIYSTKDEALKNVMQRIRLQIILSFSQLRTLIEAVKADPAPETRKSLLEWIEYSSDLSKHAINVLNPESRSSRDLSGHSLQEIAAHQNITEDEIQMALQGPSTHITTDSWTLDDALGYRAYAHSIARFITHKKTGKPLCISIRAPWGGGKTSLMRMIQDKLDPEAVKEFTSYNKENINSGAKMLDILRNMENPDKIPSINIENKQQKVKPLITIWFNAWKYESTEQVWSGLADAIIQQVSARLPPRERELFFFQLHLRRINKDAIRQRFHNRVLSKWIHRIRPRIWKYVSAIGVSIVVATFGWLSSNISYLSFIKAYIGVAGIGGLVTSVAISALQIVQDYHKAESDVKEEDAKVNIQDYLDIPDYNTSVGFIHHVEKDLQRVFDIVDNSFLPMVIFIDDLDRCSPDKVASTMEAVNLFLAGEFPNCVFVLGIDPEMVAAALEKAHSEVISKLQNYATRTPIGWKFMDKFVQLPFVIPTPERKDLNVYIETLLVNKEQSWPRDKNNKSTAKQEISKQSEPPIETNLQIQEKQEKSIDDNIERFSDQNDEVRGQISRAAHEFSSTNPREIKRFLNAFRFYYFLRAARISRDLSVPSIEQLTDWIILSLKWPQVARWAQSSPVWLDGREMASNTRLSSQTYLRLMLLEDIGEKCYKDNEKNWKTEIDSVAELKPYSNIWTSDRGLENFFIYQGSISQEKRLSAAAGTGFF